jgi:hypothetical protein
MHTADRAKCYTLETNTIRIAKTEI